MDLIATADAEAFISKYQEKEVPIATIRKILVTLNQIFSYAIRHKHIEQNPLAVAERPRESTQERKQKRAKKTRCRF